MSFKKFEKVDKGLLERTYSAGSSMKEMGGKLDVASSTISRWLRKCSVASRMHKSEGHVFNERYFKNISSDDKAYWLGVLATDGCLFAARGKMVRPLVVLKMKDFELVESFARAVSWPRGATISRSNGRTYKRVALCSRRMFNKKGQEVILRCSYV